jgi:hypothetical protein
MSATVKQTNKTRFEDCQVVPGVRPEKGHLAPAVKIASEIMCPCMGWAVSPISASSSKWYIGKAHFVLGDQPFGLESAELLLACLINLLFERFSGGLSGRIQRVVFSPPCCWLSVPGLAGALAGVTRLCWSKGREPLSWWTEEASFGHIKEPGKAQEPTWVSHLSEW